MSLRTLLRALVPAACSSAFLILPGPARATLFTVSGTLSGPYPVSAEATFLTSGSTLTLTLRNTSPTPSTIHPEQVLTGFFFDMLFDGTARPTLTYVSGSGSVARLIGGGSPAEPWQYVAPPPSGTGPAFTGPLRGPMMSDIRTFSTNVDTWWFRDDLDEAAPPYGRFGISTVGNGAYSADSNNFPQTYVGQINFGIFNGDGSDPRGLLKVKPPYLVSGSAVFIFTADVDLTNVFFDPFVFGFGTGPDQSFTILPEPTGMALAGGAAVVWWSARRRRRTEGRGRSGA